MAYVKPGESVITNAFDGIKAALNLGEFTRKELAEELDCRNNTASVYVDWLTHLGLAEDVGERKVPGEKGTPPRLYRMRVEWKKLTT